MAMRETSIPGMRRKILPNLSHRKTQTTLDKVAKKRFKRYFIERLIARFYQHLITSAPYKGTKKTPKIAVIGGYTADTTNRYLLLATASAVALVGQKLPSRSALLLNLIMSQAVRRRVLVVLNSFDSPYLRRTTAPSVLARLATHPSIDLLYTADTPHFSPLFDVGMETQHRLLCYDATTFSLGDAETDPAETVNELLGRSDRLVGGRDSLGSFLPSLPEQARELFRVLVM
ncbi:hypothetical protein IG631_24056 [Alternaria alternata]|nr:hypothetical protein IG631_24056 [Alternaria alternata]